MSRLHTDLCGYLVKNYKTLTKSPKIFHYGSILFRNVDEIFCKPHIWVIPAEIGTLSGRPSQILKTICGFESTIPRITFGVLTRSDTLASSEKSSCQVGRVGDFFQNFLRLCPTFYDITFDRVVRFDRNMNHFKGQ